MTSQKEKSLKKYSDITAGEIFFKQMTSQWEKSFKKNMTSRLGRLLKKQTTMVSQWENL